MPADRPTPEQLFGGRYELREVLGRGATSEVLLFADPSGQRADATKAKASRPGASHHSGPGSDNRSLDRPSSSRATPVGAARRPGHGDGPGAGEHGAPSRRSGQRKRPAG